MQTKADGESKNLKIELISCSHFEGAQQRKHVSFDEFSLVLTKFSMRKGKLRERATSPISSMNIEHMNNVCCASMCSRLEHFIRWVMRVCVGGSKSMCKHILLYYDKVDGWSMFESLCKALFVHMCLSVYVHVDWLQRQEIASIQANHFLFKQKFCVQHTYAKYTFYGIPFHSIPYGILDESSQPSWWSEGARHAHNVHRLRTERTCECACIVCDISISESKWLSLLDRIFSTQYTNSIPQVFEQHKQTNKYIGLH